MSRRRSCCSLRCVAQRRSGLCRDGHRRAMGATNKRSDVIGLCRNACSVAPHWRHVAATQRTWRVMTSFISDTAASTCANNRRKCLDLQQRHQALFYFLAVVGVRNSAFKACNWLTSSPSYDVRFDRRSSSNVSRLQKLRLSRSELNVKNT